MNSSVVVFGIAAGNLTAKLPSDLRRAVLVTAKAAPQFEEALALALRLSPLDKVRLVERVASTLESELTAQGIAEERTVEESNRPHWGKQLIALLDETDLSAWQTENIDDPVEWVRRQRREQDERRAHDEETAQDPEPSSSDFQ